MYQFHYCETDPTNVSAAKDKRCFNFIIVKQTQQMFQLPSGKEKLGCKEIPLAGQLIRSPEFISPSSMHAQEVLGRKQTNND